MNTARKRILLLLIALCVALGVTAPAHAATSSTVTYTDPTKHTWTLTHPELSLTNGSMWQGGKVTYLYFVAPVTKTTNGWVKAKNTKYAYGTDYAHTTLLYKVTRSKASAKMRAKTGCTYKYTGVAATYRMYLKYKNGKIVAARWQLENAKKVTQSNENRRTYTLYSKKKFGKDMMYTMFPYWRLNTRDESIANGHETKADQAFQQKNYNYKTYSTYKKYLYNKDGVLEETCAPTHHLV